jgi:hypothetical protein
MGPRGLQHSIQTIQEAIQNYKKVDEQMRNRKNNRKFLLSLLTFDVNDLNSPIKGHRMVRWIKKQDLTILYLQKMCLTLDKY